MNNCLDCDKCNFLTNLVEKLFKDYNLLKQEFIIYKEARYYYGLAGFLIGMGVTALTIILMFLIIR